MFSKLPVAIASASIMSVQARTVKSKHHNKWPQEIDDEWTSHPNFPDGPYGHAHEGFSQIRKGQRWPQAIDDEWTSHPNFPDGPYGDAHEGFAQVNKGAKWPQAIDDEWTSHPNFPDGPYGHVFEAQLPPMTKAELNNAPMKPHKKKSKKGKKWPDPEYDDSWTPHPNFPSGPYGPAENLHDPNAPGPSYPYPPGGYPHERISSAGEYHQKPKAPAKKHKKHGHRQHKKSFAQKPSDPNCTSLGCLTGTADPFANPPLDYPIDYPVPNLGLDKDIIDTHKHLKDAEDKHGPWILPEEQVNAKVAHRHYLAQKPSVPACTSLGCQTATLDPFANDTPAHPIDYKVNDLGMDHDIEHSLKHMEDAEKSLGHSWVLPDAAAVQLASDPIVDTAGSYGPHLSADHREPSYPVDYFVPDFGLDEDIVATQAHEIAAGESLGHTWTPVLDDVSGSYIVPSEDAEFKLLQTEANSDPHLQTYDDRTWLLAHYPEEGVHDVENLAMYDFAPELDHDIKVSQQNLASQELLKVHTLPDTFTA